MRRTRIVTLFSLLCSFAIACNDSDDADILPDDDTADDTGADDDTADDDTADDDTADDDTADDDTADDDTADDDTADGETVQFRVTLTNVIESKDYLSSGVFNTPDGADEPGPIAPGDSYSFTFAAAPGHMLSFATMFVQSNDWFVAPEDDQGMALFDDDGDPITGDVTSQLALWDAGTEVDQEPGAGEDQAPRQGGMDVGDADPNDEVRQVDWDELGVEDVLQATLSVEDGYWFTLTLENVSTDETLMLSNGDTVAVPFAPGVWAVHGEGRGLFEATEPAPVGLEALAEDGNASGMANDVADRTGLVSPFAPGVFVIHDSGTPLFEEDAEDLGEGLEELAEDGMPGTLVGSLDDVGSDRGVFNTPDGADEPGGLTPGNSYSFEFEAMPGDRLSFATMLVQTNDLFFAFGEEGLSLFDQDGDPVMGDVSDQVVLWDAGTEVNQAPGAGPEQAPRQGGLDIGPDENGDVRPVDDDFVYPDPAIRVELEVMN